MSRKQEKSTIFIASGGTGGHIFPARCLADELTTRSVKVVFLGDKKYQNYVRGDDGFESKKVISSQISKSKLKLIIAAFKISLGILQSILLFLTKRPKKIVAFGGYSTFPCLVAAVICKVDIILHEQNAHLGKVNRIFAKYAKKIALSFEKTSGISQEYANKCFFSGNPIRKEIGVLSEEKYIIPEFKEEIIEFDLSKKDKKRMGYDVILASDFNEENSDEQEDEEMFNILILGGSGGAKIFSEIIPRAFFNLGEEIKERMQITQQCRKELIEDTFKQYRDYNLNIAVDSFFSDMKNLIGGSHLVIARSGSSSIFEFCAAKRPMILVPFAKSADDHQLKNAKFLEEQGAAIIIEEKDFTINKINSVLKKLVNNTSILEKMSQNSAKIAVLDATEKLANLVENDE